MEVAGAAGGGGGVGGGGREGAAVMVDVGEAVRTAAGDAVTV